MQKVSATAGPKTTLGRWCGPWYTPTCDVMSKGRFADADNSVWNLPPPKAKERREDPPRRDPISVLIVD